MLDYLAGLLEWLPLWPHPSGHIAGLSGLYLIREERIDLKTSASALATSSILTVVIRGWIGYLDPVVGGLIVAGISFIGLLSMAFLRFGLLAVEEGRKPDVMDGLVSGIAQGLSSVGYGGSGLSLALLSSSGVSIRGAVLLSSISSIPLVLMQLLIEEPSLIWLLYMIESIPILILLTRLKLRPSTLGAILDIAFLFNLYQLKFIEERVERYQKLAEEISDFTRKYGSIGLFAAMAIQAVISPIPADAVLVAAGALGMSPLEVGIYGGMGIAVGSAINYFIARAIGKKILEYYVRGDLLNKVYIWFNRWGGWVVFLTRLVPFLPLDIVAYIAGAVGMDFLIFFLANVLAIIPRAAFFGLVGQRLARGDWFFLVISIVAILVGAFIFSRQVIKGGEEGSKE